VVQRAGEEPWQTEPEEAAQERFERFRSLDPYPDIAPALLNSADIIDYVRETGMIRPFLLENLKSASYEIPLIGSWIFWGQDQEVATVFEIRSPEDEVVLPPNQIAFVSPEMKFRIPDYIALRFNLRIRHIHRGLLLGTGPLVDPGFEGRLVIPLHNLTANEYRLRGGRGLVWLEFTKLSPNPRWHRRRVPGGRPGQEGEYHEFPPDKKNLPPLYYLARAHPGPIRSIVPNVVRQARDLAAAASQSADGAHRDATDAARQATQAQSTLRRYGFWGALGLIVALATVLLSVWMLLQDTNAVLEDTRREVQELKTGSQVADLQKRIAELEDQLSKETAGKGSTEGS
jgi:deoxycytidine triphosphate deaminase